MVAAMSFEVKDGCSVDFTCYFWEIKTA